MKSTKTAMLNLLAKASMKSAISAAGAVSLFGYCQPKEPTSIKKLIKS
jgi:cyclic lactone autoinducer peptide